MVVPEKENRNGFKNMEKNDPTKNSVKDILENREIALRRLSSSSAQSIIQISEIVD
jgi:hypothetical protein